LDGSESLFDYGAAYLPNIPLRRQLFRENLFSTSAIVCRRDLLLTHGLFDEHLLSSQDYELWLRLAPAIRPVFVRAPLGWYVDRAGNVTSGPRWRRLWNLLRVLHRHRRVARLDASSQVAPPISTDLDLSRFMLGNGPRLLEIHRLLLFPPTTIEQRLNDAESLPRANF
jgi:hypothetical protein